MMAHSFRTQIAVLWCCCAALTGGQVRCGTTPGYDKALFISSRIFGGSDASYGQVPWQINLYENNIINRNAAKLYKLVAGDHSLSTVDQYEQVRYGINLVIHKQYNTATLMNDIALLEADRSFDLGDFVVPACLPHAGETPFPYTICLISGWGFTSRTNKPDLLQILKLPVQHQKVCSIIHRRGLGISPIFTYQMLCAGNLSGGEDACQGDSGGPLACTRYASGLKGPKVATGIVSWGQGCGEANHAGVYTRVESYITWINEALAGAPTINADPCKFSGIRTIGQRAGVIASPGYSGRETYKNGLNCVWEIDLSLVTEPTSKVVIAFEDVFDIELGVNGDCRYDSLRIYFGERFKELRATLCGNTAPSNVTFQRQPGNNFQFRVVFHTDNTVVRKGFLARYAVVEA